MAIRFYDEAMVTKIKGWIKDPNMVVLSPADSTRLFQLRADQDNDKKLTLPLIALSRDSEIEILSTTKKALSYDGVHLGKDYKLYEMKKLYDSGKIQIDAIHDYLVEKGYINKGDTVDTLDLITNYKDDVSKVLNAIPIKITYQLDIYTKYFAEADEYARNFIFNFINYPKLSIEIPYNNAKVLHDSTIMVESTISDSSDIPERLIAGQFHRMTIRLTIDDAWMFSVPFMDNWKVEEGSIEVLDN